jgi:hypothetical protein
MDTKYHYIFLIIEKEEKNYLCHIIDDLDLSFLENDDEMLLILFCFDRYLFISVTYLD